MLLGVVITGLHYNIGNYCSVVSILLASLILFSINIHKRQRRLRRRRARRQESRKVEEREEKVRPISPLAVPLRSTRSYEDCVTNSPYIYQSQNSLDEILDLKKPELTCISEEGIAGMDLPDNILEELEYLDNITSCNKVENCLMLSEYEQNLIKEKEGPVSLACRRARKWSLVRQSSSIMQGSLLDTIPENGERRKSGHGELARFRSGLDLLTKSGGKKLLPLSRNITTIPEDQHTQSLSED